MSGLAARRRPVVMTACGADKGFRIELIREVAEALAAKTRQVRPTIGTPVQAVAMRLPPLPIEARRARLEAAIAWLKARFILVSVCDRNALVRRYRVSGRRYDLLAEDVIEHAEALGMTADKGMKANG